MTDLTAARGRRAVAASILAVTLIASYFVASVGGTGAFPAGWLVTAAVLALGFWFPAMRLASAREVLRAGERLIPWMLAWTLVWDLATAGLVGGRELFEDWWIVYPAGVLIFAALLLLHGSAVNRRTLPTDQP